MPEMGLPTKMQSPGQRRGTPRSAQIIPVGSKHPPSTVAGICVNNKSQTSGKVETAEEANSESLAQVLNGKNMPNKFWIFSLLYVLLGSFPPINALSVCFFLKNNNV